MSVTKPEDMANAFAEAFNSGDIESVLALYESNAVMVREGTLTKGGAALREVFTSILARKRIMTVRSRYCAQTGDVALSSLDWTLNGSTPEGISEEVHGTSVEVIRRQGDGRWLYVIDHPRGAD